MSCFWFGHRLPSQAQVIASITYPDFQCARCKKLVLWDSMPKKVRAMRDEYLRRRSRPEPCKTCKDQGLTGWEKPNPPTTVMVPQFCQCAKGRELARINAPDAKRTFVSSIPGFEE